MTDSVKQSKPLQCKVVSTGAWGGYFESYTALQQLFAGGELPEKKQKGPKPAIIPANERRRAPLPVRLAVESSWQAAQKAEVTPDALTCVFVSGFGDTDLTDYMCKVLASDNKELSPTKFHNSVHNAAAGYWTISTDTMRAANSVAGYQESVSLTLFEAMVQCEYEDSPMLVTFYDAPVSEILKPLLPNDEAFAFSLVLYPASSDLPGTLLTANVNSNDTCDWPELACSNDYIQGLYRTNPSARVLCLAESLEQPTGASRALTLPLSAGSTLSLTFS
ncbi:beta-ketoacyl synthase chain length factor [Alteromonas halophila]|uniref:Beta-ketoacyl synthase-like N-terminal domain-containing protein n=1 Tax=Alteromonas halophila TaxID=516698 RepID=A0A918JJS0_9ALTE|nr:beta-ketoacyl synthase chain length factor [Alteromonas halophila]GGW84900.1 hypothetical protein GCM10007391_18360 [Alteromonas halophila]